jgi:predicted MPP superfamily phosphohydrolase
MALAGSLLLSGLINTAERVYRKLWRRRRDRSAVAPQSAYRRRALQRITALIPLSALAASTGGMAQSFSDCRIREIPLPYPALPPSLEGLKILHISDCHLGPYVDLDDLERLLLRVERFRPDLALISGDIADELSQLPGAIKLFEGLNAPLGAFACMGNHDYYRGERRVRGQFDRSSVAMLVNAGVVLKAGGSELFIGGADDPRRMGVDVSDFMRRSVDQTLSGAPTEAFKIIMSHRPTGFDRAAESGVQLTVAGHTHGGQVGFLGRPLFEPWGWERHVWGKYQRVDFQLYVSSGVGHWFPFRLGCPTEAPILILKRGNA